MKDQIKKVVQMALGADLFASLLYIFALSVKNNVFIIMFYFICLLLIISAFLACYNNYKKNSRSHIYLYMIALNLILLILYTFVLFKMI